MLNSHDNGGGDESTEKQCRRTVGLRPWKPGQSGNPKGRTRKARALSEAIRAWLEAKDPATKQTRLLALIERLYQEDPKTLLAYGFGCPVKTVELTPDVEPVEFRIGMTPEELGLS